MQSDIMMQEQIIGLNIIIFLEIQDDGINLLCTINGCFITNETDLTQLFKSKITAECGYIVIYKESNSTFQQFLTLIHSLHCAYIEQLKWLLLIGSSTPIIDLGQLNDKVRIVQNSIVVDSLMKYQQCSFDQEPQNDMNIPLNLEQIFYYFQIKDCYGLEGIFRKNGNNEQIERVYKRLLWNNYEGLLEEDPHVIACVFKKYLYKMPQPLINRQIKKGELINDVLNSLSIQNLRVLYVVIGFIREFIKVADLNKMGVQNMAIMFAPCLLRSAKPLDIGLNIQFLCKLFEQFEILVPNYCYSIFIGQKQIKNENKAELFVDDYQTYCDKRRSLNILNI